jgi:hypothetical protein
VPGDFTDEDVRCHAALNIKGEHFGCVEKAPHGGLAHRNPDAEAIWQGDTARVRAEALREAADWMASCQTCHKIHVYRDQERTKVNGTTYMGGTWASEDDGHAFLRVCQDPALIAAIRARADAEEGK